MLTTRPGRAYRRARRALAREAGDPAIISHALTNIGVSQWFLGDPAYRTLDEASGSP
jgi:hypothetical protein